MSNQNMRDEINAILAEMGGLELDPHGVCSLIVNDAYKVSIEAPQDACVFMLHSKVASRASKATVLERALGINLRLAGRPGSKLALDETNGDIIYIYTSDVSMQNLQELLDIISNFNDNVKTIMLELNKDFADQNVVLGEDVLIRA